MPRDASGNYTLPAGNPVVSGTIIDVNWANPTMGDIAVQLNNVLTRDGLLGPIGPFLLVDGTVGAPGLAFSSEHSTGLYKEAPGLLSVSIQGTKVGQWSAAGYSGVVAQGYFADGTAALPSIAFEAAHGTGFWRSSVGNIIASVGGEARVVIGPGGQMGVGIAPSPWAGNFSALQVHTAALYSTVASNDVAVLGSNIYHDGINTRYIGAGVGATFTLAASTFAWHTAPVGVAGAVAPLVERMRIDAAGNVGIGTTTPVDGGNFGYGALTLGGVIGGILGFQSGGTEIARLQAFGGNLSLNVGSGNLAFVTSSVERMHISADGTVLIGTPTAMSAGAGTLNVRGSGEASLALRHSAAPANHWNTGPNLNGNFIVFNQAGVGVYLANGGTAWIAQSDERLKTELQPIENALDKVSALRAVTGAMIEDEAARLRPFLIAQDVQAVLPEAVYDSPSGMLGLAYTDVIPLLVAAIKELNAKVDAL